MQVKTADGTKLHVIDQSPPGVSDAPIVLWMQGLNAPASAWAVQMAHFGRTHRSISFDARGVGKSDAPPGPYSTSQLANDAIAVLDALQISQAHVVGLSLGGAAAQELAIQSPDRVKTLALLSTFAHETPRASALLQGWRALFPLAHQSPEYRAAWEKQAYAWLFTETFWKNEANVRAALRFAATQPLQSIDGYRGQIDAALAHDTRGRLPAIAAPTLVLHGALDQLASVEGAEEIARQIPGAKLVAIPSVGHAINLEAQRAVHAALRELWAR
jgi:3-oxoadipate enol-lactonase